MVIYHILYLYVVKIVTETYLLQSFISQQAFVINRFILPVSVMNDMKGEYIILGVILIAIYTANIQSQTLVLQ